MNPVEAEAEDIASEMLKSIGIWSSLKKEPGDFAISDEDPLLPEEERMEKRRAKIAGRIKEGKGTKRKRMDACETYFAIMKGYCTMSMFNLPIGFKFGGWLFSPLVLFMACFVETFSAIRLT